MKSTLPRWLFYAAIACICVGLVGEFTPPAVVDRVGSWIGWNSGITDACIIKESKDSPRLEPSQLALLNSLSFPKAVEAKGATFWGVHDQNILDSAKQPPKELVPFLEAARDKKLPVLLVRRGSRITAIEAIQSEAAALEAIR